MASFSFGFMALLTVSVTRASHGAAGPMTGQQLVAVLVNDLQIVSERRVLQLRRPLGPCVSLTLGLEPAATQTSRFVR